MAKKRFICSNCGYIGKPESEMVGCFLALAFWALAALFLFLFLPVGIICLVLAIAYTVYSMVPHGAANSCPKCKAKNMVPEDTPKGKELLAKAGIASVGDGK